MADSYSLYLVRHAIAAERGDDYPDDAKRPLTGEGMSRFRKAARGLVEVGVEVDLILTSPFVRARQTADILSEQLRGKPPVVETNALVPGAPHADLVAELANHATRSALALVGHEPGIGTTAARLVGARGAFAFKKGGVCRIDVAGLPPAGPGQLVWFVPPKMLVGVKG
jgi:phosphohistidine phosphatase